MKDLPIHPTMIRTNASSNYSETSNSLGALFSYTCKEDGFLILTDGYPEEVDYRILYKIESPNNTYISTGIS